MTSSWRKKASITTTSRCAADGCKEQIRSLAAHWAPEGTFPGAVGTDPAPSCTDGARPIHSHRQMPVRRAVSAVLPIPVQILSRTYALPNPDPRGRRRCLRRSGFPQTLWRPAAYRAAAFLMIDNEQPSHGKDIMDASGSGRPPATNGKKPLSQTGS